MSTAAEKQPKIRPTSEAERDELIDEIVRPHPTLSVEHLLDMGYSARPIIPDGAYFEEQQFLKREAYNQTVAAILAGDYPATHGDRVTSTHSMVDRETARKILKRLSLHDSTWRYARRLRRNRLEVEASQQREAARLSNRIEAMVADYRGEQQRSLRAELRQALEAMVDGDGDQLATVADLAERLGMSPANVKNLAASIEQQRGK